MAVAYVAHEHGAAVPDLGTIGTRQGDLDPRIRTMPSQARQLILVYAAGPGGAWLSRSLTPKGHHCWVVAPSLMPHKAGDRGNTARRDAGPLARLLRSGALTPVSVPSVEDEALRDRSRAHEEAMQDLKAAQLRRTAVLRRPDIRDTGRAHGRPAPLRGRSAVVWPTPAPHMVFQEDGRTGSDHVARLQRVAQDRHAQVNGWRLRPVVAALQARRGVQLTGAVTTVADRGDLARCDHPRPLLTCFGLIPSEDARAEQRRQGSITQAGHLPARRALMDGAWAARSSATGRRHLPRRRANHPNILQDIRWKAHVRLGTRVRRLIARGKHATQVGVAMARALVGLLWAMAQEGPVTPEGRLTAGHGPQTADGVHVHRQRRRPGLGVILAGVTRPLGPTRASSAAGPRRRPVRWYPIHG
jgi:transposase